jgi:nicotinate phosphoribosyltransferase
MRALATDLYQLTMAAGYFHRGLADTSATFELFVRRLPKQRRYLVADGIEQALEYLEQLAFHEDDIAYLAAHPTMRDAMTPGFVDYLRRLRFRGEAWAVPEGTVLFAGEPFLRIRAPLIEAQLVETYLLSAINYATMIASKAARIVTAAKGRGVLEFGTRRTHPEAAITAARSAYLVGAVGTSNLEAGRRFDIPVLGTAAHSWTMAHDDEEQAFANYVETFPNGSILLIDTYDALRGAERAARIAKDKLKGVRIDSGDIAALSREVRKILDAHGLRDTKIVASGDLHEYSIAELLASGTPVDLFGVGTELVCSKDAPSLGGVYKLVEWERCGKSAAIAKFSEGKTTYPGSHQIHRFRDARGVISHDVLALADEPAPQGAIALLEPAMRDGRRTRKSSLDDARARATSQIAALPSLLHELAPSEAHHYSVEISAELTALTDEIRERLQP